ncbi:hypothetical protein [Methylomonas sp. CM2]|uniref:hypothetical protein n=1 Tax=Methylomonas sp. CM2 TaxID=3417647 RepID=UPI003CF8C8DE
MMTYQTDFDSWKVYVEPLQDLGLAASGNSGFTAMLAFAIKNTGKAATELTIAEALQICNETRDRYNTLHEDAS